jgi:hypothetical protein
MLTHLGDIDARLCLQDASAVFARANSASFRVSAADVLAIEPAPSFGRAQELILDIGWVSGVFANLGADFQADRCNGGGAVGFPPGPRVCVRPRDTADSAEEVSAAEAFEERCRFGSLVGESSVVGKA